LLESLGITRIHTVMGASMGALQAYDWAARYPDRVGRIIPVIGSAEAHPWLIAWLDAWAAPIRLDPKWNGGDYHGKEPPLAGLAEALKLVSLHANHWEWAGRSFGRAFAEGGKDPLAAHENRYRIETFLGNAGLARARVSDANHFLYLVRANQTFAPGGAQTLDEAAKKIKAPTLLLYAPGDQVFPADWIKATEAALKANGVAVESAEIAGPNGHLNGVVGLTALGPRITQFMSR
jgi:homoserine O-acetyltransferase